MEQKAPVDDKYSSTMPSGAKKFVNKPEDVVPEMLEARASNLFFLWPETFCICFFSQHFVCSRKYSPSTQSWLQVHALGLPCMWNVELPSFIYLRRSVIRERSYSTLVFFVALCCCPTFWVHAGVTSICPLSSLLVVVLELLSSCSRITMRLPPEN